MTTWEDLKAFIASKYQVVADDNEILVVLVDTKDERSQYVMIFCIDGEYPLIVFNSAIGPVASINATELLAKATTVPFGIREEMDQYHLTTTNVLATIDPPEIVLAISMLGQWADRLERMFVGTDDL